MPFAHARPIPRIEHPPDFATFHAKYLQRGEPVLMRNGLQGWGTARWDVAYLREVAGDAKVVVAVTRGRVFRLHPKQWEYREMTFREFLALQSEGPGGTNYYLQENDLLGFGRLKDDVVWPAHCDRTTLRSMTLSFGPAGAVTPLHYDFFDNCLAMVSGTKRFILFPPSEHPKLSLHSPLSELPQISRLRLDDEAAFDQLRGVEMYECVLEPGDMLFVPVHWAHQVFTDAPSMSINFWHFAPFAQRWMTRAGLRVRPLLLKHWPQKTAARLGARLRRRFESARP